MKRESVSRPFEPEHRPTRKERKASERRIKNHREALLKAGIDPDHPERRGLFVPDAPAETATTPQESTTPRKGLVRKEPTVSTGDTSPAFGGIVAPWHQEEKVAAPAAAIGRSKKVKTKKKKVYKGTTPLNAFMQYIVGVGSLGIAIMLLSFLRLPVLEGGWWKALVVGVILLAFGLIWTWRYSILISTIKKAIVLGLAVLLTGSFVLGTFTSVIVDGKVYASTSKTAKAYEISFDLKSDLTTMAQIDTLLAYDQTQARAHYDEYDRAIDTMGSLRDKWTKLSAEEAPNGELLQAMSYAAQGGDWGAEALNKKKQNALQPDVRLEQDALSYRQTFNENVLSSGAALTAGANAFGIDITSGGPRE